MDSGSTDGSAAWAGERGIDVVALDMSIAFTAARARNEGFRRIQSVVPELTFVQFIDGDCELNEQWPQHAIDYLDAHPDVAAVCGRRRERFPEKSVYNWLCEMEWNVQPGEARAFGGDVMIRAAAFENVGGYRDDLIAGEEPELCIRLRAAGWRIWRLPHEMTSHDAAMTRFSQWWRRATRAGYAFAQGARLHGASPERHWVWETRRTWLWAIWLPLACLIVSGVFWPWGLLTWFVYPLQILRQSLRNPGSLSERTTLAFFQVLHRFPEAVGQFKFLKDSLLSTQANLVEYK